MRRASLPATLLIAWTAASVAASAQISVVGRIDLPGGSPAAGVEVELHRQTNAYEFARLLAEGRHRPEPIDTTLTRRDGSYELRAPEPGMLHLYVAPAGYRSMELNFWPLLEDRRAPDLELVAETPVRVRVSGADGSPMPGAHVRAKAPSTIDQNSSAREYWRPAYRQAITDERGTARIGRGADDALEIYARAPGHLEGVRDGIRTASVDLRLSAGAHRAVRVETIQGDAIAGAVVRIGERRWPVGFTSETGTIDVPVADGDEPEIDVLTADGGYLQDRLLPEDGIAEHVKVLSVELGTLYSGRLVDGDSYLPIASGFAWIGGRPEDFARTDSTGGYTLRVESSEKIWLWGAAPGYLHSRVLADGETSSGPTVALQQSITARGVVVDERDQPVPEATVTAAVDWTSGGRVAWQAGAWLSPAVADRQGRFTIPHMHPDVTYLLRAARPGFAAAELQIPKPRTDALADLRIVLEAGRSVIGGVIDLGGAPVPGARLELTRSQSRINPRALAMRQAFGDAQSAEVFSDQEGRFAFPDQPAGVFDVRASAAGYAPSELAAVEVPADATEVEIGEVVLGPGFSIEGRVTDTRGSALEGAQILVTERAVAGRAIVVNAGAEEEPVAVSDVNGFFSVVDRREGEQLDVTVRLPGYAEARVPGITAPTSQAVSIRLERASTIRGEVVDSGGRAIPDAQVSAQVTISSAQTSSTRSTGHASTDANGLFVIEGAEPGEVGIRARAEGFVALEIGSLLVKPGEDLDNVRLVMEPGASISGRITGPTGRPVSGAHLMMMETGAGFSRSAHASGRSDGEGRYRLEGVPPGSRSITVRHPDFRQETRKLEVELGDNPCDISLRRGAAISGRVVDESGQPVSGADIALHSNNIQLMGTPTGVTNTAGDFLVGALAEGIYTLQVFKDGFAAASIEGLEVGPAGLDGLEIGLEAGGAIAGNLAGLDPADYADVEVFAVRPPRGFSTGRVSRDGSYRVEDLAPGEYNVQAQVQSSGLRADGRATVVVGVPETLLDLEFKVGLTLTGTVLKASSPLPGAGVNIAGIDVSARSSGSADSEGRFRLQGLEPGTYYLTVQNMDTGLSHREQIELRVDRDVTVRLETAVVSGFVRDADDARPLQNATVQLETLDTDPSPMAFPINSMSTTDSAGFFKFSEASAGSYRLLAQKEGFAPSEASLTVLDGSDQEGIEISLSRVDGLRVYVTLPSGQPAQSFFAAVLDAAGNRVSSSLHSADEDGGTDLSLAPGDWEVIVGTGSTAVSRVSITAPGDPVAIPLAAEARLVVKVPELEDEPTLATVTVFDANGQPYRGMLWLYMRDQWPMARGTANIQGLAAGAWAVRAEAPDGRSWDGQVQLAAGDNPELILR